MVEGFWPIFFLAVILKIPIAGLLYLVWWAIHQTPETEEAPPEAEDRDIRRRPKPRRPRGPRRGPHAPDALPLPGCPPGGRLRVLKPPAPARAASAHARGSAEPTEAEPA
jgi:hypothetical protein